MKGKKIIVTIFLMLVGILVSPSTVLASIPNPVVFDDVPSAINQYASLIPLVSTVLFIGVLMYGGFIYLTAGDNEEKVGSAKKIIIAAIAGFAIIVLAPAVVNFVGALLGVDGGLISTL